MKTGKLLVASALLAVAAFGAAPAKADSFYIGFASGSGWGSHGKFRDDHHRGHGRGWHHWHGYHRGWGHHAYGPPVYYRPYHHSSSHTIIYTAPPVVERRVIYRPVDDNRFDRDDRRDDRDGRYCREYQTTVRVGGVLKQGYGTACMQPDGSWERVD